MKTALGILLIVAGLVFGLWAGIWWAFIGGIIQVIVAAKATPIVASAIAWGILKVICSGLIGWIALAVLAIPGAAFIASDQ